MAVDGIVGQCRGILCLRLNLSVGNKSQFDQRLESVTDTKCQSIALREKLVHCLGHLPEGGGKELCGALRLISCGEAAREHDNLGLVDGLHKLVNGISDIFCT